MLIIDIVLYAVLHIFHHMSFSLPSTLLYLPDAIYKIIYGNIFEHFGDEANFGWSTYHRARHFYAR